jgi:NADH dehydrogenase [ubiquinone] 1 alpha subcomplex assembly factor 3
MYSDVFDGESPAVHVKGFDEDGHFVMGNGSTLRGSLLCYSGKVFVWERVKSAQDISCDALSLLRAVKPKPDILVVGYGVKGERGSSASLSDEVRRFLYELNISFELVDTRTAISTFNILQQDGRRVIAALLPMYTTN